MKCNLRKLGYIKKPRIYLTAKDYNDTWIERVVRGFGDSKTLAKLQEMFEERCSPGISKKEE
jgi:hypothetical protein